ncbi:ATP-grasp domain-containing protein [Caulobacter sp. S45]|uniref:carboxylate--amine ligase n=1 Tax=Caulobacter sp. S45 TaxID=1641861 RepID=UPI00131B227B|nr:ATP-grasp domain-containing protein [Caulobacter sp. S45]
MALDIPRGRVIVTYGRSLMALTIAHSLGSRGVEVIGCDDVGLTVLSFSRYAKRTFVHASAAEQPDRFIDDLEAAIIRNKPDDGRPYVLMPCFQETRLIARHAERLSRHITVAAPPIAAIEAVDPKDHLLKTARAFGLHVPATCTLAELRAGRTLTAGDFPLLLKPAWGVGGRGIRRIDTPEALARVVEAAPDPEVMLLQQFVVGQDYCLTALFDHGVLKASAAYRNLSQFPRNTGAGVLRETVDDSPFLDTARALFGPLGWTGVVEVDFRWDGTGQPYLIEVNPRFWAGLFHTVESGVDFPWMLYELVTAGQVTTPATPRLGQLTKVGGLYLLAAVQEIADSDEGFAASRAAWKAAAHKFESGKLLDATRELGRALTGGLDVGRTAGRLKAALGTAKNCPNELFRSEDPLVSLGALFVLASLMRHGRLPPELRYDSKASDLMVE